MPNFYDVIPLKAANKATADQTYQVIDVDDAFSGFNHMIIDCTDCNTETMFSIDKPVSQSNKIIYVKKGMIFDEYIHGDKLYYSCASGTNIFNYVLL